MNKEQRFYNALKDVFVGTKVEGQSGYINLMKVKSKYFENIFQYLQKDVSEALIPFPAFREELFDKLYNFFHHYFSKSGSIYFTYTPIHQNVFEQVYTDDKDVILFWKTHMLYYVKTDRLYKNLDVEIDGFKFFFDVSTLEHKKANEKRELVYEFKEKRKDGGVAFTVSYSERGKKTKTAELAKSIKRTGVKVDENILENAFRVFEKQSEVDYFINKNAKKFLQEQLDIWFYQYVFSGESQWTEDRIKQLQTLKELALKIIDFISQFEDELVKIWNKPKFVLNSNYVITLDRIAEKDFNLLKKLISHKNFDEQCKEWKDLGIIKEVESAKVVENKLSGKELNSKYKYLPIDTKYFKDIELEILQLFENLDESLDGWLIKSENYQALNTILPKFREKVQVIYIDPPFNTGEDFFYVDRFQDSTWLSLMWDRINISKDLLGKEGAFYLHIDRNSNHVGKIILNDVFGEDNFKAEITWDTCGITGFKSSPNNWIKNADYLMYYSKSINHNFFAKTYSILDREEKDRLGIGWLDILGTEHSPYVEKWCNGVLTSKPIETEHKLHPGGMLWTDIYSFLFTQVGNNESFFFKTQKPEHLLRRIVQSSTSQRDLVLDFFLGIGTTIAVAQKLNRKWVGVEMADYADTIYESGDERRIGALGRMKIVLSGDQTFSVFGHPRHPQLSRNLNWQGGGFFKYYELEQYEDVLRKAVYQDVDLFADPYKEPYSQYVFLKDEKMLATLEVDYEKNKVEVDLSKLYQNVDIPETISNLLGKWITKVTPEYMELENGEKVDLKNLDYKMIKPLIWW